MKSYIISEPPLHDLDTLVGKLCRSINSNAIIAVTNVSIRENTFNGFVLHGTTAVDVPQGTYVIGHGGLDALRIFRGSLELRNE